MDTTIAHYEGTGDTPAAAMKLAFDHFQKGTLKMQAMITSMDHIVIEVPHPKEIAAYFYASIVVIYVRPQAGGLAIPRPGQLLPHA